MSVLVGRIDARLIPVFARDWREASSVARWRERVAASTFPTYFGYLYRFLRSIGLRYRMKEAEYAALRSFFQHNRVMLPKESGFQIRSDKSPVERKLTIERRHQLMNIHQGFA